MNLTLREVGECAKTVGRGLPAVDALVCIPRGGITAGALIIRHMVSSGLDRLPLLVTSEEVLSPAWPSSRGFAIVDDVLTTGTTVQHMLKQYPNLAAARILGVLVVKSPIPSYPSSLMPLQYGMETDEWVVFPWETPNEAAGPADAVRRLLEYLGEDPSREALRDTPARVLRFYDEIREQRALEVNPTTFESEHDDLVTITHIPFMSLCEHHALPYFGEVSVGYIPHGKLLGLSKIARAVQRCASGLTVQEHLTREIADLVAEWTGTADVAVTTTATHTCMVMRGARAHGAQTPMAAMLGAFRANAALRAEFYALLRNSSTLT